MTITRTNKGIVREDWWCNNMSNLTERMKQIARDVNEGDTGTSGSSLREEFEAFKLETAEQFYNLRKDLQELLSASQQGN